MAKELKTTEKIDMVLMNPTRALDYFTQGAGATPMALVKFEEYMNEMKDMEGSADNKIRTALIRMAREFII
jgi:uncharacterized cupredoxin-like copper-binding protein